MEKSKLKEKVNWPVTILLIVGLITVLFPLNMTVVIAVKSPTRMSAANPRPTSRAWRCWC